MKHQKFLFLFILLIFSILNVSAYIPHKQNTNLELVISSNNATSCNVSYISSPNGKDYLNLLMTKNGNSYNLTLNKENFTSIGTHCMGIVCTDGVKIEDGSVCRDVSVSGSGDLSAGSGLSLFGSLVVIILVGIFFFVLSFRFNNPTSKFAMIIISSIILLISVFYSMVMVQQNLGGFSNIIESYSAFFMVLKIMAGLSLLALILLSVLVSIRYYKFKRGWID